MKINYTMFSTALTGGHRVILEIANRLSERGHDVTITTLGAPISLWWFSAKAKINYVDRHPYIRKICQEICRKIPNKISSSLANLNLADQIKLLAENIPACDINVATLCFTAFSVFRSEKGIPFYHMQHFEPLFFRDDFTRKMAEETYYLPINKIANCIWLRNQLGEKHGLKDIPIVNPAIDHNVFYPRERRRKGDKFRIISLGKSVDWKGLNELFGAMRIVYQKRRNIELVLFEQKRWKYPKAEFPFTFVKSPFNESLAELYGSCDLFVSASWYESFPLPPLEAMACGTPVITTRYGTEDYAVDGINSLVVPPKAPELLAEAILRLLEDRRMRQKISEEGIKTAKQFTWERTVDKVEEIFKGALSRAGNK